MRIKSSSSNAGSPKKAPAPCCSNTTMERKIAPTDEEAILP